MSLQLTLARSAAAVSEDKWRHHKMGCVQCSAASHRRKDQRQFCHAGYRLWEIRAEDAAELRRAQELERQPIPGQLTLDDVCEGL